MALLEVVLEQEYFNQRTINRFNYVSSGSPASVSLSFALISALGAIPTAMVYPTDEFIWDIANLQSDDVSFIQITAKDVYDPTDFYELPFVEPLNGFQAGSSLSPAIAWGVRSTRSRLDIRRGTKRFVGVREEDNDQGGMLVAGALARLQTVCDELGDVKEYNDSGNILTFSPCIVQKERYQVPGSDPPRFAYDYFEDESEQLSRVAQSIAWQPYPQTRTQTSRQYGRGI